VTTLLVRNVPAKHVQADEIWTFCYTRRETSSSSLVDARGIDLEQNVALCPWWCITHALSTPTV